MATSKHLKAVFLLLVGLAATSTCWAGPPEQQVDYFSNNGFSNTVSTMQHPAGEHYKG